jgi:hypothetical protein
VDLVIWRRRTALIPLVLSWAVLATTLGTPAGGRAADPAFPAVEGRNLSGRGFALPGAFDGCVNLVFVAFKRQQQDDVDTWLPAAARLAGEHATLRYYELPTLGRGMRLMRSFIDGGMRSGIPDEAQRDRTITLYIDKDRFRRSLQLASEDTVYALVIDRDGRVLASADGRHTTEKEKALVEAIRSARC